MMIVTTIIAAPAGLGFQCIFIMALFNLLAHSVTIENGGFANIIQDPGDKNISSFGIGPR